MTDRLHLYIRHCHFSSLMTGFIQMAKSNPSSLYVFLTPIASLLGQTEPKTGQHLITKLP